MSSYKIAHIREQGVDLIIAPLESAFGMRSKAEQQAFIAELQRCAADAGLRGTVVPVWQEGNSYAFIAPPQWFPFFKTLGWNNMLSNINKTLHCQ